MILLDMKGHAECVEPGCTETMPVDLGLLVGGGIGFRATRPGWQIAHAEVIGAPFQARCPKHARRVGVVTDLAAVRDIKGVH